MMTQLRQRMLEELQLRNYCAGPFDCTSTTSPHSPNIFIAPPINWERRDSPLSTVPDSRKEAGVVKL